MYRLLLSIFTICLTLQVHASVTLQEYITEFYHQANLEEKGLGRAPFLYGIVGFENLKRAGLVGEKQILAILDFSQRSNRKRFYFFDLRSRELVHQTFGTHGKNSGEEFATRFSNTKDTHMSSLGFYTTFDESYMGRYGHAIRLMGHDLDYNDNAYERAIVLHGAPYATAEHIQKYGQLGRSWGCPAVPENETDYIIDLVKERSVLFIYYPDPKYIMSSKYLDLRVLNSNAE